MAEDASGGPYLKILGPTVFGPEGGKEAEILSGKPAALLCKIALNMGKTPVPTAMDGLWHKGQMASLDHAAGKIKNEWGLPLERKSGMLWLNLPREAIDAHRFLEGVARLLPSKEDGLPLDVDLAVIDELLNLWRADPRQIHSRHLRREVWGPVIGPRDRLLAAIAGLAVQTREKLDRLPAFLNCFPFEDKARNLLKDDGEPRAPRPRLLVVDDQQGSTLKTLLFGYDCVVVRSISAWSQLVDEGPLEFDGALIDLHLTSEMNDEYGYHILKYLQEKTSIPALLMSVRPIGYSAELERKYGAIGVYYKDDDERFSDIRPAVDDLLRKGRRCRRAPSP